MATHYVDSGAGGANDGTSWANAWTSLASAVGVAAGDEVRIDYQHNQNPGASATWTFTNGTAANPVKLVSCDPADDSYRKATAAQFSGAASDLTLAGHVRGYGLYFDIADDFQLGNGHTQVWDDCTFEVEDDWDYGGDGNFLLIHNSVITFVSASSTNFNAPTNPGGWKLILRYCTVTGGNAAGLFSMGGEGEILVEACDISYYTTILSAAGAGLYLQVTQCKVNASVTLVGSITSMNAMALMENCDDGTNIGVPPLGLNRCELLRGIVATDTTRTRDSGGATDGTTPYSWEMTADSDALSFVNPLESPPMRVWVQGGSAITITVYIASTADKDDDEFWIEVIGPDEAAAETAQGHFVSTRTANIRTAPAAIARSSGTVWQGTNTGTDGGAGQQKCEVTYTPALDGWLTVRAYLAVAATVYVDPNPEITNHTSSAQRFIDGVQFCGPNESGGGGGAGPFGGVFHSPVIRAA